MHDGETIDVFAPFGAFPGASRHKNHLIGMVDINGNTTTTSSNSNFDSTNAGSIAKASSGDVEPQQLDSIELAGGNNDNNIADNVDGFLDEFLALVDPSSGGGGGGEGMDDLMDIAEEGLDWLEDMDPSAFLPPPATPDAALAGAASNPLPSSAHEIDPVPEPEPVVVDAGAGVFGGAGAAVASQTEGSSLRSSGHVPTAVGSSGTAAGAASSAGLSVAFAGGGGDGERNGLNDGGAVANGGGDGSVVTAGVSRKEQLRRQKVARYLAKKKNRQWSKAKASSYQSRQRVANSRPRHKGRFLPLESDFVSIEELQRRQRALMKQMQEKAAAARAAEAEAAAAAAEAPSSGPTEGEGASSMVIATAGASAAAAPKLGNQVAI